MGTSLRISLSRLTKLLRYSLERGLIDLAVIFDDVDKFSITIGKGRDLLGHLSLAHHVSMALKDLNKDDSLVGDHVESIGKCFVIQCSTSMTVDVLTKFCPVIN